VEAVGLDFIAGPGNRQVLGHGGGIGRKPLVAGVVDGWNVWRTDLSNGREHCARGLDRLACRRRRSPGPATMWPGAGSGSSGAWFGTFALAGLAGTVHPWRMDGGGPVAGQSAFTRLAYRESLRLLVTVPVGRLIFTVNALPTVRPMNFAVVDDLILLRTAAGSTVGPQGA
jgi:Pyridoxamine 5'-phosphate oxidase